MKAQVSRSGSRILIRNLIAVICAMLVLQMEGMVFARQPVVSVTQETARIPADQLDSLVAPIALYPDPLLSQTLVASTYPLEIMQLQQWLEKNKNLKDKALMDAVSKQPWDPSIQAMAGLPDVVKRLADDIQWATDLGNAFLAQQSDVMDAVQRMRQKAQNTGALKSNQQQKVEKQVIDETKTVIVVEQADPQVVYVPSYDPLYVYGEPAYPYPPIYYPPYPAGVVAASAVSFGVGFAIGAAWAHGGWGWNCGWGNNNININNNNNFIRNSNISGNRGGGNNWQHDPKHRGGTPYKDRATADKFGGTARGDSLTNRQSSAKQQIGRQGGNLPSTKDRASGVGDRSRTGGVSDRDRTGGVSDRSRQSGGGGGDRVGSRDVGRSSGGGSKSAFGGGPGGFNGSSARASSSRGASSMGSRGGMSGGMRGGAGGRRR